MAKTLGSRCGQIGEEREFPRQGSKAIVVLIKAKMIGKTINIDHLFLTYKTLKIKPFSNIRVLLSLLEK
jgi:hypothetical protein